MITINQLAEKIISGYRLSEEDAVELLAKAGTQELCEVADQLRSRFTGDYFDTCSIMNARSGKCTENCKWCSQSIFHNSDIEVYPLVGVEEAVQLACSNAAKGVRRFSLVTSGRTMTDREVEKCCKIYDAVKERSDIYLCASMGLLSRQQLQELYNSGVRRYHCNLETAPSYFGEVCTTHTVEEKMATIKAAMEIGMEVCSGGIIGMGETMLHRVELAVALQKLGVHSIPVNVLNPVKGTALENSLPLTDQEIIRTMAIFRIINPQAHIRLAGGRILIKHLERKLLRAGVSSSIVGDMLTTTGSDINTDRKMFSEEGFCL